MSEFFSVCFMLISAATGMGILTLPWSFMQMGLTLGIFLLSYWSLLCGSTIYLLILGGLHYKVENITELVYYSILGEEKAQNEFGTYLRSIGNNNNKIRKSVAEKAAIICDIIILFDCLFMIPCLLIFLSDFLIPINQLALRELPKLFHRFPRLKNSGFGSSLCKMLIAIFSFFTQKYRCVIFFCLIVFLISLPKNSSAIKLASFLSVLSSISTSIIILYNGISSRRPAECSESVANGISDYCKKGEIEFFNYQSIKEFWKIAGVSNIILFSYFCHLILIPVTKKIQFMSTKKIKYIVLVFILTIFTFNCSVGISGYSIFRSNTLPNIINNFPYDDPLIVLTRIYLTLSLTVTICMEIIPLIDSFSSTIELIFNTIKALISKSSDKRVFGENECVTSSANIVDEDSSFNNCTSTLMPRTDLNHYVSINKPKEQSEIKLKEPDNLKLSSNCGRDNLSRICYLVIVLSFSGVIAVSFSSVAKLIQITGGTLDGVFIFIVPAWIYYSTYFTFHNKFFGIILIAVYTFHFLVSSFSGIMGLFEED